MIYKSHRRPPRGAGVLRMPGEGVLMSVRIFTVLALAAIVGGCSTVSADKYARDMGAQKEYIGELEKRNQELESQNQAANRQLDDATLARTSDELYGQIARQLEAALASLRNGETDGMKYNSKTGAWEMGTDLLFDSGSDKISAKGGEILKKFADAHKGQSYSFRIVGHTETDPHQNPHFVALSAGSVFGVKFS